MGWNKSELKSTRPKSNVCALLQRAAASPRPCSAGAIFAGGQMADFYLHEIRFRA
jgi:hypothetical protein